MAYYKDLRDNLKALEEQGKLIRVTREVNKDTEIHPLVRLQYRGLPEEERKAFLFEKVTDSRGRRYKFPYCVCTMAGSQDIYAIGLMCKREEIRMKWAQALMNPIEPKMVDSGPAQEEVHIGDTLLEHGGLDEFPIPISTPGYDNAPYFTSLAWVTKDPETGIRNLGTYRAMVKSPTRTTWFPGLATQHMNIHASKARERGQKTLEAAIINGFAPNIGYAAVTPIPYGVDEYTVAGGMGGEPIELVKCKTVDLEVPAHAEVVIEGELSLDEVEPEAPFGEATGYVGPREMMPYFTIKCISHRKDAIWQGFLSQFPPSESTAIRRAGGENATFTLLRIENKMEHVLQVALPERQSAAWLMVIQMKHGTPHEEVWQTLETVSRDFVKMIVAVGEDINPWDTDAVLWAICSRSQPHRDFRIVTFRAVGHQDLSLEPPGLSAMRGVRYTEMPFGSTVLIDATIKWPYRPVSLPKKEFMERALEMWGELELPPLKLVEPWWGYSLGEWSDEDEEEAMAATRGEYYKTGEKTWQRRRRI